MAGDDDDQFAYDGTWPSQKAQGLRKNFMDSDDKRIIQYLLKTKDVVYLKGYEVWKRMQHSRKYNPRGFSYHSLHQRWRKTILPSIHRYGLTDSEKELLLCKPPGYFAMQRKIAKGRENRRLNEGKSLLDQLDDSSGEDKNGIKSPRTNTMESDGSDSVSGLEIRGSDFEQTKNEIEANEVEKTPSTAPKNDADENKRSPHSRYMTLSNSVTKARGPESPKGVCNGAKRRALFVEESPVTLGSIRDADGLFTPSRATRNHNMLMKLECLNGTKGRQAALSRAEIDDPTCSECRDSIYSSSDESCLLDEPPPRTSPKTATIGISTHQRAPASQTLLREAVTDSLPLKLPNKTAEDSSDTDKNGSDEKSAHKRQSRTRLAPVTSSTCGDEAALRSRSDEHSPTAQSPQRRAESEKDRTVDIGTSEEIRGTQKLTEGSSVIRRRSSQEESSPDEYEANDLSTRGRMRDTIPSNLTARDRTLRKRPPSLERERSPKKLRDDALVNTVRVTLSVQPNVCDLKPEDGREEETPNNQLSSSQAEGPCLEIDTMAETQESAFRNRPGTLPLRKVTVEIPWDENERTRQALEDTTDGVGCADFSNSTQPGDRIQCPRAPCQTEALTAINSNPSTAVRTLKAGFSGTQSKGLMPASRSSSKRANSQTNWESSNTYYLGTSISCVSSADAMLDVSVTSRFRIPLPEALPNWTMALRLLRESAESTFRQHDATNLESHAACPGLGEYLELWSHLKVLLEHANAADSGTLLRRWRESRVVTLISEILSMPVCRAADTNTVATPLKHLGDQSVICSQLRTPEWQVLMDVMDSIRDAATSIFARSEQQK
ncbi:hypothetical protein BIW11_10999 [Tropilaelaps mercedesae]|uniref:Uncharacterized protein n=1 Tax=Tropilaelaps mercedesae TaxID=418985 RepID=A0A1V9XDK3_9ACAR|nr:hypothetical protein BIW11_10999 [Tropilaelaps mercedesae]